MKKVFIKMIKTDSGMPSAVTGTVIYPKHDDPYEVPEFLAKAFVRRGTGVIGNPTVTVAYDQPVVEDVPAGTAPPEQKVIVEATPDEIVEEEPVKKKPTRKISKKSKADVKED